MLTILPGNGIKFRMTGEDFYADQQQRSDLPWPCFNQPIDKRYSSKIQIRWTHDGAPWLRIFSGEGGFLGQIRMSGSLGLFTAAIDWSAYPSFSSFEVQLVENIGIDPDVLFVFEERAKSEMLEDTECLLVEYWNNVETEQYGNFDSFRHSLHVPALLLDNEFPDDTVDFTDSKGNLYNLDAEFYDESVMRIDQSPFYFHRMVRDALAFHNIKILGEQWVRNGSYNTESVPKTPLAMGSVTLRKVGSAFSNVWRAFEPLNLGDPIQHLFSTLQQDTDKPKIALDGTVFDYTGDRSGTVYPSQGYKGDTLTWILVEGTFSGNNTVSYYDAVSEAWKTVTGTYTLSMQNGGEGIEFQFPNDEIAWNVKGWNPGYSPTSEEIESVEFNENIAFWYSGEEGSGTDLFDMAGNNLHALAYTAQADFHVFDGDGFGSMFTVKHNFVNTHGFSPNGSARVPVNMSVKDFDANGNILTNKGRINYNGRLSEAGCVTFSKGATQSYLSGVALSGIYDHFNIAFWFNPNNNKNYGLFSKNYALNDDDGVEITSGAANTNNFVKFSPPSFTIEDDRWHWFEFVFNRNGSVNYADMSFVCRIDGEQLVVSSLPTEGWASGVSFLNTNDNQIGAYVAVSVSENNASMAGYIHKDLENSVVLNHAPMGEKSGNVCYRVEGTATGNYTLVNPTGADRDTQDVYFFNQTYGANQNSGVCVPSAIGADGRSTGFDVLGNALDTATGEKFFDLDEKVVFNPYNAPDLSNVGFSQTGVAFDSISNNSGDVKWSRHEPESLPSKKSDMLAYPAVPSFSVQNSIKKYLNID